MPAVNASEDDRTPFGFYIYMEAVQNARLKKELMEKLEKSEKAEDKKKYEHYCRYHQGINEFESLLHFYETRFLMHRLTQMYYGHRAKWFTFFPLLLFTTLVSICGFLGFNDDIFFNSLGTPEVDVGAQDTLVDLMSTSPGDNVTSYDLEAASYLLLGSNDIDSYNKEKKIFAWVAFVSGLLGVFSTCVASCGKYHNYQSKADMHAAAVAVLSSICAKIKLDTFEFTQSLNHKSERIEVDCEKYRTTYDTMKVSCTSPIPFRIRQAFDDLDSIFRQLGSSTDDERQQKFKILYPRCYYGLLTYITRGTWFPNVLVEINVEKFCKSVMRNEFTHAFSKRMTTVDFQKLLVDESRSRSFDTYSIMNQNVGIKEDPDESEIVFSYPGTNQMGDDDKDEEQGMPQTDSL